MKNAELKMKNEELHLINDEWLILRFVIGSMRL